MKILVRNGKTGLYLGRQSGWGPPHEARVFTAIDQAGVEAFAHEDADVILSYDEPKCELALNPVYCAPSAVSSRTLQRQL